MYDPWPLLLNRPLTLISISIMTHFLFKASMSFRTSAHLSSTRRWISASAACAIRSMMDPNCVWKEQCDISATILSLMHLNADVCWSWKQRINDNRIRSSHVRLFKIQEFPRGKGISALFLSGRALIAQALSDWSRRIVICQRRWKTESRHTHTHP